MEVKTRDLGDGCKANRLTEMFQYHIQYNRRVCTIKILNNTVLLRHSVSDTPTQTYKIILN